MEGTATVTPSTFYFGLLQSPGIARTMGVSVRLRLPAREQTTRYYSIKTTKLLIQAERHISGTIQIKKSSENMAHGMGGSDYSDDIGVNKKRHTKHKVMQMSKVFLIVNFRHA